MDFKNFKKHLVIVFALLFTLIPMNIFAYSDYIIPGGENIGMQINSNGILVVGTYEIDNVYPAKNSGITLGDKIININGVEVNSISEMVNEIEKSSSDLIIDVTYVRNDKNIETKLELVRDSNGVVKTGLYVKDNISGIGTLTFIDPESKLYGALGHEILEKTTGYKMEVKDGQIYSSIVTSIDKSVKGNPGQKNATYYQDNTLGDVTKNTISGLFGNYTTTIPDKDLKKVAQPSDIIEGKAIIMTVINQDKVEEFEINIIRISTDDTQETKNILFEITDERLLDETGGVIQGMSGSPIIQGDYIIGAVTHVVVDDATKGYGIFITNMLETAEE